jgi:hypothetical protein
VKETDDIVLQPGPESSAVAAVVAEADTVAVEEEWQMSLTDAFEGDGLEPEADEFD